MTVYLSIYWSIELLYLLRRRMYFSCANATSMHVCVVDNKYDFTYLHPLKSQTGDYTVEAKEALVAYAESHGVGIKHFNTDNGTLRSK